MAAQRSERHRVLLLRGLCVLALVALCWGWYEFLFLTDDAFITFRYISNRHLGFGYVWNAPPFRPVEGYSNFLWMVLLDVVWTVLRVEPPSSANVLSLLCAGLTTWRVWRWTAALGAPTETKTLVRTLIALGLLLSNRTFLTWSSSGLETALFNLFLFLWFEQVWREVDLRPGRPGYALLALWASLSTLTRPDGLLTWAATLGLAVLATVRGPRGGTALRWFVAAGGALALVPAHLVWRRVSYGEWLPNTYYAKHVAPWPEAGVRYLGCFVLEYGYWCCAALAVTFVVLRLRSRGKSAAHSPATWWFVAVGTYAAHTAYYVLRVGGDHFEYRVLSEWVPVLAMGWAWLLTELPVAAWVRGGAVALSLAAALPIQWVHYAASRVLTTRAQTWKLKVPVQPALGAFFGPATGWFDETQGWLIEHHVGMRHQEHKVFGEDQRRAYPLRRAIDANEGGIPVIALTTVGVPGWALPNVAVIDLFGLNDFVVARNPVASDRFRLMAHDRAPPGAYVECFRPNVSVGANGLAVAARREVPLEADEVRACEDDFAVMVGDRQVALPTFVPSGSVSVAQDLTEQGFVELGHGPSVVRVDDFEEPVSGMELSGMAFGSGPTAQRLPAQSPITGATGRYLNSYHRGDFATGMVTFALPSRTRRVAFKLGGGASCESVWAGVVQGERLLAKACAVQGEQLRPVVLTIEPGENQRFVVFDASAGAWGHIIVDDVISLDAER